MRLPVRSIFVSAIAIFLISLVLTTTGVIAAPGIVSDFLSEITGIKESAIKAILDPTTGKIPLKVLPTGHNGGFDADLLDGQHGSYYASSDELKALSISVATLSEKLNAPSGELILVSKLNGLTGEISLVAGGGVAVSKAGQNILLSFTGVSSLTGGGGITVSSSTGEVTLGTSSIPYASLNLSSSIVGADLASGINISTTGNIATTGTGSITSAGLLTASNGLTLSAGALSFPANSIADSYLSTNVALLTGIQTFTGSKTFASALLAPTSTNTINGLIINSGALSGITTIALSGALSGATTITGSGNINTTGGSLQTNGVIRIDNSGNLTAGTGTFGGAVSGITTLSLGGNLTFSTDNAFDIGAAGATRPRNIYTASNIYLPNAVAISGRNAANSAWIDLVKYDASNNLVLGGSGGVGVVQPVNDGGWDFGTASLRWGSGFFGGSVRIGTNPASTGNLRLPNAATISQRNAGNTADEAIWPIENTTCAPPSNQSIGTANTWVDACSVTLTAGTWFITAAINISTTSQSSHRGRIYNSTDAASVQETISYISSAVGDNDTLPIVAILTITGTKTIKLQGTSDGTTGTILQNATNPGGGGTTRMVAVRLGY